MSHFELTKRAAGLERVGVADPTDTEFWDSIGADSDGKHALVIGDLDDALAITGDLDELTTVAERITEQIELARRDARR